MSFPFSAVDRRVRARVYVAAMGEANAELGYDAAYAEACKSTLSAKQVQAVSIDAVNYALACHAYFDLTACRIATSSLNRRVIMRPVAVLRRARQEARRIERRTRNHLALRLFLEDPAQDGRTAR